MGYFAAAAMNQSNQTSSSQPSLLPEQKNTLEYLRQIDADELSPKQAHDALYRLKKLLGSEERD